MNIITSGLDSFFGLQLSELAPNQEFDVTVGMKVFTFVYRGKDFVEVLAEDGMPVGGASLHLEGALLRGQAEPMAALRATFAIGLPFVLREIRGTVRYSRGVVTGIKVKRSERELVAA